MSEISKYDGEHINAIWNTLPIVSGKSASLYRKDINGNIIFKRSFKKNSAMGYDISYRIAPNGVKQLTLLNTSINIKKTTQNGGGSSNDTNQTIFRKLTKDMPRKKYEKRVADVKNILHWGQLKLLLTEIEFLTLFMRNVYNKHASKKEIYVIYAGAAPGTHINLLSELFQSIHFELYDPRPFDKRLNKNKMINTHNQLFLDDDAKKWISNTHKDKYILLISDIRTADTAKMSSAEIEDRVKLDHKLQYNWYKIIKPAYTMLKFRLPWMAGTTKYLKGDIYIQPFPPVRSTETRLIISTPNVPDIYYDNIEYEEQLYYFNTTLRDKKYRNILEKYSRKDKCGLTDNYDSVALIHILSNYLELMGQSVSVDSICNIINRFIKTEANRRTLFAY